jgi:hypothetical protein
MTMMLTRVVASFRFAPLVEQMTVFTAAKHPKEYVNALMDLAQVTAN